MTAEQIKIKVKEAYENVDSGDFLQLKIKQQVELHRINFKRFKEVYPDKDFEYWKYYNEAMNINSTNNQEIMAMGIYFLALDEFKPDD
ncbi:hypothetical protein A0O34_14980 [Chryseobacterium glaciei]|uniref:Uncharacterized protein n=1 Tax=Chryseobacterium glaciei TaxID=1685010 RepID=A0A172XXJ4_9FLAO|nr:hypothetical protein [Chryseobacterium glaciei]ANF51727.1 hypothetical protein A0O34_14980 [Chryseobacterium glaciei]